MVTIAQIKAMAKQKEKAIAKTIYLGNPSTQNASKQKGASNCPIRELGAGSKYCNVTKTCKLQNVDPTRKEKILKQI